MLCLKKLLSEKVILCVSTILGDINTEEGGGRVTSHITSQAGLGLSVLEDLTRHSVLALLLALWPLVFHLFKMPIFLCPFGNVYITILSWSFFSSHSHILPGFLHPVLLVSITMQYIPTSPNLYSKPELLPKSYTIKSNCLLDSSPWIFHKYLKFTISKTQPIAFTRKSALLSLCSLSEKLP